MSPRGEGQSEGSDMLVVTGMKDCPVRSLGEEVGWGWVAQSLGKSVQGMALAMWRSKEAPTAATSGHQVRQGKANGTSYLKGPAAYETARLQESCYNQPTPNPRYCGSLSLSKHKKCGRWASPTCQTPLLHTFVLCFGEHLIQSMGRRPQASILTLP